MKQKQLQQGFTLIELLFTTAIVVLLATIAVPSFNNTLTNWRVTSAANQFKSALIFARTEAVKRGDAIHVAPRSGSSWGNGIAVFVDANGDDDYDIGEEVLVTDPVATSLSFTSTQSFLRFDTNGILNTGDTVTLCPSSTTSPGRTITILASGLTASAITVCGG